jgi:ubiquinone/menaquinone biosynthesis C-methylase UbiE
MNSVEETYNTIAKDFNKTRYKIWRCVLQFIESLESNTKMLEVGCGNGKNMLYRNNIDSYGIDISEEQVEICRAKGLRVEKANMTLLPYGSNEFDNIICIATYHHLDNANDRRNALLEMYRVLKSNGKLLLTVWAMEQELGSKRKFTSSDEMVSWELNGSTYYRYYHIYKEGELEEEIREFCTEFKIESVKYELGNWSIIVIK